MKNFPKTVYVIGMVKDDDDEEIDEFITYTSKSFIEDEEVDTEVAVYQLVKVGTVSRKSRIVFDD